AEILFAGIHIPMTIYNDGAKETFGEDFVNGLEIAYIISGFATLGYGIADLPNNLVTLTTNTGKTIDYIKGGALATGTKIKSITINTKEFLTALPSILKQLKSKGISADELF